MRKLIYLLIFFLFLAPVYGQDYQKIDSLKQILKTFPELDGTDNDTLRLKLNLQLGNLYLNIFPDTALYWYFYQADTAFYGRDIIRHPNRENINAELLLSSGTVENNMGNYLNAKELFNKALSIYMETQNITGMSRCYMSLGNSAYYLGDYNNAISNFNKSAEMAEEINNKKGISDCLSNMGVAYSDQGDYKKALEYYEKAFEIRTELNDKTGISSCLINLGIVNMYQGDYPHSVDFLEKALSIAEELNSNRLISFCVMNLGAVTMYQGNFSKAIEYDTRAYQMKEQQNDKKGMSQCLLYLAAVHFNIKDYEKAIEYYEKSVQINEQIGDKFLLSYCYMNVGAVYLEQKKYLEAEEYFEKNLILARELDDKRNIASGLRNLSMLAFARGFYQESLEFIEKSVEKNRELGLLSDLAESLIINARIYIRTGAPEKAMPLYLEAKDIIIKLLKDNFSVLSEAEKEDFLNKVKDVFSDVHFFNCNYGIYDESLSGISYNNELMLKGLLLKSTSAIVDGVYNSQDSELRNTYISLKQIRNAIAGSQGSESDTVELKNLEEKANEMERTLVKLSSEFAGIYRLFEYRWEDVRENLETTDAAIEFISYQEGEKFDTTVYGAIIITAESKCPEIIKLFNEFDLVRILGKNNGTSYTYINNLYGNTSRDIYKLIWKPLENELTGIKKVYYAPVGALNKISFAALLKESGEFLCDNYDLQQVSTTGILIGRDMEKDMEKTIALFGGIDYNSDNGINEAWKYLPGTLDEINTIEKIVQKDLYSVYSFSGREANESDFKNMYADNAESPCMVHVATHGFFYPDPESGMREQSRDTSGESGNTREEITFRGSDGFGLWMFIQNKNPMMRSGLVFAGANSVWCEENGKTNSDDGVLTSYEVANLNMRKTDLIVLSACETGLGDIKGSEGVYGLQRAFKMAGVKYIIMSLWQVPDKETVLFMETFYKKLLKSKDVRKSFNETQKEMRKKYDPYFWGAFVLVE